MHTKAPSTKKPTAKAAPKVPKTAAKAAPKAAPKALATAKKVEAPKAAQVKVAKATATKVKISSNAGRPYFYANGKRKTAIATVRLYKNGEGKFTVNDREFEEYFPVFTDRDKILSALRMANAVKLFDINAHVQGSGIHAQADAIRHAISKALLEHDITTRAALKSAGYLTRDPRIKERKKYGLHRARRAPQFSKR